MSKEDTMSKTTEAGSISFKLMTTLPMTTDEEADQVCENAEVLLDELADTVRAWWCQRKQDRPDEFGNFLLV